MQVPTPINWEDLTPQQRIRIIHLLVQMLLHQLDHGKEAQDERHG